MDKNTRPLGSEWSFKKEDLSEQDVVRLLKVKIYIFLGREDIRTYKKNCLGTGSGLRSTSPQVERISLTSIINNKGRILPFNFIILLQYNNTQVYVKLHIQQSNIHLQCINIYIYIQYSKCRQSVTRYNKNIFIVI